MRIWLKKYGTQMGIGMALAVLPVLYVVATGVSWHPLNPHEHLIQNGLAYGFLLLFSYFNHTIFVPRWFLQKRYRKYALITVCCVLAAVYLPYRIEQWAFFNPPLESTPTAWFRQIFVEEMMLDRPSGHRFQNFTDDHPPFSGPFPGERHRPDGPPGGSDDRSSDRFHERPAFTLLLPVKLAIFFLLGSVSTLLSISVHAATRLRQVENDQLQAELRQLKAQIQPHFLFNTLNSIYALAIRNDVRTADTIVKLSEFLRYIIRDAHRDQVPLTTEINYLANYIDLQKARLRDAVEVDYRVDGALNGIQIAPLILFSFVENAFKYGVNPEEDSRISIHLSIQDERLQFYVANNKVQVSHLEASTGIGLRNTQERLRLLYPVTHQLTIENTPTHFRVTLHLILSE